VSLYTLFIIVYKKLNFFAIYFLQNKFVKIFNENYHIYLFYQPFFTLIGDNFKFLLIKMSIILQLK
jgi:hypothetical protein